MLFDDNVDITGFSNTDDVVQKLARTVILYQSEPYVVTNVNSIDSVSIRKSRESETFEVKISDIDFLAPKLGLFYDRENRQAIMPNRWCNRQYQGGLPPNTLSFSACNHKGYLATPVQYRDVVYNVILSKSFSDMLNNVYPTVSKAVDMLRENAISVPIRRFHWVTRNKSWISLYFKDILLAQYCFKQKKWTDIDGEQLDRILSLSQSYTKEFVNYVNSVQEPSI